MIYLQRISSMDDRKCFVYWQCLCLSVFLILNYKYCHSDNVRQIFPPTSKRHHDVISINFSMDFAPNISRKNIVKLLINEYCNIFNVCLIIFRILSIKSHWHWRPIKLFSVHNFSLPLLLNPVGNYMIKVNNRNTRTRCEISSKLTNKDPRNYANGVVLMFYC